MNKDSGSGESFPGATSKFRVGQRCLVLKVHGSIKAGTEVVLVRMADAPIYRATRKPVGCSCWHVDKSYEVTGGTVVVLEKYLMPLDDPKVTEQIKQERLDMLDESLAQLGKALDQFDSMVKDMEKTLYSKRAI